MKRARILALCHFAGVDDEMLAVGPNVQVAEALRVQERFGFRAIRL